MRQTKIDKVGKYSEDKLTAMCKVLRMGGSVRDAAMIAGTSVDKLMSRIAGDEELAKLFDQVRAEGKLHHLTRIYNGERQWQSSAWILERLHRQEFQLASTVPKEDEEKLIRTRQVVRKKLAASMVATPTAAPSRINTVVANVGEDLPEDMQRDKPYLRLVAS